MTQSVDDANGSHFPGVEQSWSTACENMGPEGNHMDRYQTENQTDNIAIPIMATQSDM
jgi:hypothetical protein